MTHRIAVIFVVAFVAAGMIYFIGCATFGTAAAQPNKFLSIREINAQKPATGTFETQGFVAKIYTAPACPPDAQCKPSMNDNIVISEDNKTLETYDLSEKELILFTDKTAELEPGKKYRFTFNITDQRTTNEDLNDIELISREPLSSN